jgi:hypothetical protein
MEYVFISLDSMPVIPSISSSDHLTLGLICDARLTTELREDAYWIIGNLPGAPR